MKRCSHRYHASCVGPWLAKAVTCPACREVVTEEAVAASLARLGDAAAEPPQLKSQAAPNHVLGFALEPDPEPELELDPGPDTELHVPDPTVELEETAAPSARLSVWQRLSSGRGNCAARERPAAAVGPGGRRHTPRPAAPPVRPTSSSIKRAEFISASHSGLVAVVGCSALHMRSMRNTNVTFVIVRYIIPI